jgi:uncharacterized protein
MDLALAADPPLRVREFDFAQNSISYHQRSEIRVQECRPFAILNVDYEGNFSTYSPELLGLSSPRHAASRGNVARDSLESVLTMPRFVALDDGSAVAWNCAGSCRYFPFCGWSARQQIFENGDFATTETLSCRLHKKATFDVALDKLERLKAVM